MAKVGVLEGSNDQDVSRGQGAQQGIGERIRGLGSDLMFIRPGATTSGGVSSLPGLGSSLFYEDEIAIGDANFPYVEGITSYSAAGGGQGLIGFAQDRAVRLPGVSVKVKTPFVSLLFTPLDDEALADIDLWTG